MLLKRIALFIFVVALLLSGCQSPELFYQTEGNVADIKQRSNSAIKKSDASGCIRPALSVNSGQYIDRKPINLNHDPSWLHNSIIIRGDQLPFSYYSRTIADGVRHNILTQYQIGLDPSLKISMNYSGTVKGALEALAAKAGYVFSINNSQIYWQAFVTKTFDVAFMPGVADYQMGKSSSAGGAGASTTAGTAGGIPATGIVDDSSASQYSNLKGTLSIWKDLEDTIRQLISADGKVVVSQATTSVTVRDKPPNVDLIGKYIANLNHSLSKQVLVKIQVLEVTLSSDYNYGINWNIVQQAVGNSNYILNTTFGTPISLTAFDNTIPAIYGLKMRAGGGPNATGFTALINALKQQGMVSVVSEPRVVCLNNQVSAIRIVSQKGYLASVQNTTVAGAGSGGSGGTVTSQLTPGTLVTGLTLYILPKIMGRKVYLQVNADLSNDLGFGVISSAPTGSDNSNASQIQTPNITQKQFNQRSVIGSGDTLILAGFRQIKNQTAAVQLFDTQALGSRAAVQDSAETIVLITPIVLNGFV